MVIHATGTGTLANDPERLVTMSPLKRSIAACISAADRAMLALVVAAVAPMTACGGSSLEADVTQRVDIGGRALYLECRGTGSPTVVLEAGLRNRADVWSVLESPSSTQTMVLPGVAAFTRVCAYDRPGTTLGVDQRSRSDPVPMPRTVRDTVADLHALLTHANIAGPYVLVGHSTGGLIVRLYATEYPEDVAGMVWVEALPDDMRAHMTPAQYTTFVRLNTEPPAPLANYAELETIGFDASFEQMREAAAATPLRPMPLVVLSRGVPTLEFPSNVPADFGPAFERAWQAEQRRLVTLVPGAQQIVARNSGHYIMIQQPDLVIEAIRNVVEAALDR